MEGLLGVGGAIVLCVVLAVYLLGRRKVGEEAGTCEDIDIDYPESSNSPLAVTPVTASRPRLTELQFAALLSAAFETIYIESESNHAAADYEPEAYPKRTIESLVKRGLLEPVTGGGFRATPQGRAATVG
ncbi:hypothetical protein [Pseudomonas sp. microsymbiont 2]